MDYSQPDSETEEDLESKREGIMVLTVTEFVNFDTKVVPEFDGTIQNLQRFIDGITLMETQIGYVHANLALTIIKTKLTGNSRGLISNEATIQEIIAKLKSKIKGESTDTLTAKLMGAKQGGKPINSYAKEIEELALHWNVLTFPRAFPINYKNTSPNPWSSQL